MDSSIGALRRPDEHAPGGARGQIGKRIIRV